VTSSINRRKSGILLKDLEERTGLKQGSVVGSKGGGKVGMGGRTRYNNAQKTTSGVERASLRSFHDV